MKTITTNLSADEAVEALKRGIEAQGMRLVSHINGQANARLIGKEVPADQVLEVFRPDYALRVWEACKSAGIDIPLRIHVYAQDEKTHVALRRPTSVFAAHANAALSAIGEELDAVFHNILAEVPET